MIYITDQLKAPEAAINLLDELENSIARLSDFPYAYALYRPIRHMETEYRFIPVKNYTVFYSVKEPEKVVEIHRILYAKMDLNRLLR